MKARSSRYGVVSLSAVMFISVSIAARGQDNAKVSSVTETSIIKQESFHKNNLVHFDVLAPIANSGMYGVAYERIYKEYSNLGGPASFLIAVATADEVEMNHQSLDDLKGKDFLAIGILGREYSLNTLSGLYGQYGISYITGDAEGIDDGVLRRYEIQGGEIQGGLGLQLLIAKTFVFDVNITGRVDLGTLKNKGTGEDDEDEFLVGWGFAIAGGVGFAF